MNDNERLQAFLKELAKLTEEYGFEIGGCGCCGSPWLIDHNGNMDVEELHYDCTMKKYTFAKYL